MKKTISLLLAAVMLIGMLPVNVFAAELPGGIIIDDPNLGDSSFGDTSDDLLGKVDTVLDGSSFVPGTQYVLADDLTVSQPITHGEDADTVIDLQGYTIHTQADCPIILSAGSLTLKNGSIEGPIGLEVRGGSLTLENMQVSTQAPAVSCAGGSVAINGGTYTVEDGNIFHGEAAYATIANCTLVGINGRTYEVTGDPLIFQSGSYSDDSQRYEADGSISLSASDGDARLLGCTVGQIQAESVNADDCIVIGTDYGVTGRIDTQLGIRFEPVECNMADTPYSGYYVDCYLIFQGIAGGSFTADGCALVGSRHNGGSWYLKSLNGYTFEDGSAYPIFANMLNLGSPTCADLFSLAKDQAITGNLFLTEEVMARNPDLKATFEIRLYMEDGVYLTGSAPITWIPEHTHSFGTWQSDAGSHWQECAACGDGVRHNEGSHTAGEAVMENVVEATCTEAGGYDSVVYCTTCGAELSRTGVEEAAPGHDYDSSVCTRCGDVSYVASGTCGAALTWTLTEDGTLTIDGSGNMTDYSIINAAPWKSYQSQITALVIAAGVTSIGKTAFYNCTALKKVTFLGDAPAFNTGAVTSKPPFQGVTAICYYPGGNATWTDDKLADYGGTLTWTLGSFTVTLEPVAGFSYGVAGTDIVVTDTAQTVAYNTQTGLALTAPEGYSIARLLCAAESGSTVVSNTGSSVFNLTGSCAVTPVFIAGEASFRIGSGDAAVYYYTWTDAFTAAAAASTTAGKTVIVNRDLELPGGPDALAQNLLTEDSDYVRYDAAAGTVTYIIPNGATLLVPYNDKGTLCTTFPTTNTNAYVAPTAYRTLTMPAGTALRVDGALSLSAQMWSSRSGNTGCPMGPVSFLKMERSSAITVGDGGKLYAYGFITGSGTVTARSGATVYEEIQVADFRGATASSDMNKATKGVYPANQYYVQNIEVPLVMEYGATEYVVIDVALNLTDSICKFIAPSGAFFTMSSGTVTKHYDGSADRLNLTVDGGMSICPFKMDISVTVHSENFAFPFNSNMTLKLLTGSDVTVNQDIAMLPGSALILEQDAAITLASGTEVYVYDAQDWGPYAGHLKKYLIPVPYAPGKTCTRTTADLVDARVEVGGTIDASQGSLYTTAGGANICANEAGTGRLILLPGAEEFTYQMRYGDTAETPIAIDPARLQNADGSSTASGGNGTGRPFTYFYRNGLWQTGCPTADGSFAEHHWTAATCTAPAACSVCGWTEGSAPGHTEEILPAVEPTCDAGGLTEGRVCTACGTVTVEQTAIDALGHSFGTDWFGDDVFHWHACGCGARSEVGPHADDNNDHICNICQAQISVCSTSFTLDGSRFTVTQTMLDQINNSTVCGDIGFENLLRTIDYAVDIMVQQLDRFAASADLEWILAYCFGIPCDDAAAAEAELMRIIEDYAIRHGISIGDASDLLLCRALLLQAFREGWYRDPQQITEYFCMGIAYDEIRDTLTGSNASLVGLVQCMDAYFLAYRYLMECDPARQAELTDVQPLLDTIREDEFGRFLMERAADVEFDILASFAVMDLLLSAADGSAIYLMENGFGSGSLSERIDTMLNDGIHSCEICGKLTSPCVWEETITTEATCTEDGLKTLTCRLCAATRTEVIEAPGHDEQPLPAVEPTCDATGLTAGSVCAACGTVIVEQTVMDALGHAPGEAVQENTVQAACTTDGSYDLVVRCVRCPLEYSRETIVSPATGVHTWVDGVCSQCGAPEPAGFEGTSMTLGGTLALNFVIDTAKLEGTGHYAIVIRNFADSRASTTTRVERDDWMPYGGTRYAITCTGLAAKEMGDCFQVVVYNSDGAAVSQVYEDSIRAYAMRMIAREENGSKNPKKLAMYVDMLNYGAAAQAYFSYNTADPVNGQLTAAQQAYGTASVDVTDQRISGPGYAGSSLTLADNIQLNFVFNKSVVTQDMYAVITYTNHTGDEKTRRIEGTDFLRYSSTRWYITIDDLVVADGGQLINVTICNADGTVVTSVSDSVNSYAYRSRAKSPLYDTLLRFTASAYNYFH